MSGLAELAQLVGATLEVPPGGDEVRIDDVVADSRQAAPGALFCCVRGERHDGHDHAAAAVDSGAVALLCDHPLPLAVPQLVVDDVRRAMGPVAAACTGTRPGRWT